MATLTIRKNDGTTGQALELADSVFGIEPNVNCVRAAVATYLNAQRAGTHNAKTRAFVSGGGKKPWKQKGTGRARQGSTRAPHWRHGAIIFGPSPRDYTQQINKKVKRTAFCSIWSNLVAEDRLIVIDGWGLSGPKTKELVGLLEKLQLFGTALLVTDRTDETLALSARNLGWATATNMDNLNVYDLLNHEYVVTTPDVVKRLEATYAQ